MNKIAISVALGLLFLVTGGLVVFADDAPSQVCRVAPVTSLDTLKEGGLTISDVSQGEIDKLTDAKGSPPGAEGKPFTVKRIDGEDKSMLVIIQGDCINDKLGPVPSQLIDNTLGSVKASG